MAHIKDELRSLWERIKENVIDALGLGWLFDDTPSKVWDTVCVVLILCLRWTIKLVVFILVAKLIMGLLWKNGF